MKNFEMKIEGDRLIVRHPDGVVVLIDFSSVRPDLRPGAMVVCGVKVAVKPLPVATAPPKKNIISLRR